MPATAPHSQQLHELQQVATRLGLAFGREAEAAETPAERVALFNLFDRCFFSVRVSIALQLRLRQEARRAEREDGRTDRDDAETERDEAPERAEASERPERCDERDRDRETERASLPLLLDTLDGVVAGAAALTGPAPAELPTLTDLLTRLRGAPPAPVRTPPPRTRAPLRARLTGSTTTILAPPPRPAGLPGLAPRRSTGPP
jgi:hypothetical protein